MKFDFSPDVRRVLSIAREEAIRLGHPQLGTEHQLLALLSSGDDTTLRLLDHCGITAQQIRQTVEAAASPGGRLPARSEESEVPYTLAAKKVLEDMMGQARESGSTVITPEHLLRALVREKRGSAGAVLRQFGITDDVLRSAASDSPPPSAQQLDVQIDDTSDRSVYEQIVAQIQEGIATGELQPGERLPPVRGLADRLNIAPGTVARAYSELERLGLVITRGSRGTRVAERRKQTFSPAERPGTLVGLLRPVAVAAFHLGATATELRDALEEAMENIFEGGAEEAA